MKSNEHLEGRDMTKLNVFIAGLSDHARLALATTGILATLCGIPVHAEAGDFFKKIERGLANATGDKNYTVQDLETAVAFDTRTTAHLAALLNLSRAIQQINLYGRDMTGREKANNIKSAYLVEYSKAPYGQLQRYDRYLLDVSRGVRDRRIEIVARDYNDKKQVLRAGASTLEDIASALKVEDYNSVQQLVRRLSNIMESRAVPLLRVDGSDAYAMNGGGSSARDRYPAQDDYAIDEREDNPGIGFSLGR
jgi:hypothetical protein